MPSASLASGFNRALVDTEALSRNFLTAAALCPAGSKIMAVVKGDAYGHGLLEAARIFAAAGAGGLGVLDVMEGLALRRAGLKLPIFVLAGAEDEQLELAVRESLTVFVYRLEQARRLAGAAREQKRPALAMIKIDTGMGRLGFPAREAAEAFQALAGLNLTVVGLATHLATAGDSKGQAQLAVFDRVIEQAAAYPAWGREHSALASSGILSAPPRFYKWVRPGLILYGYQPGGGRSLALKPALSLVSRLIQVRDLARGETVSYDRTFTAPRPMRLGSAPCGYIHGLGRARSGRGWALVRGRRTSLLGRVCMNLTLFDLTDIPEARPGDELTLLGTQAAESLTADDLAAWEGTISYEIIGRLGNLNPRFYR